MTASPPALGDAAYPHSKFTLWTTVESKIHPKPLLAPLATPLLRARSRLPPPMPKHGSLLNHLILRRRMCRFANGLLVARTSPLGEMTTVSICSTRGSSRMDRFHGCFTESQSRGPLGSLCGASRGLSGLRARGMPNKPW